MDLPIENGDLPIEHSGLSIEKCDNLQEGIHNYASG